MSQVLVLASLVLVLVGLVLVLAYPVLVNITGTNASRGLSATTDFLVLFLTSCILRILANVFQNFYGGYSRLSSRLVWCMILSVT